MGASLRAVLLALLYVKIRRQLRTPLLAALGVVLLVAAVVGAQERFTENAWLNAGFIVGFSLILLLPLVRFGLLPFAVGYLIHTLLATTALTTDLGTWYSPPTWVVGGLIVALAVTAFVQSRAGAPLFGRLLED